MHLCKFFSHKHHIGYDNFPTQSNSLVATIAVSDTKKTDQFLKPCIHKLN